MIQITEKKLRAALQITLSSEGVYSEERENYIVNSIIALSESEKSEKPTTCSNVWSDGDCNYPPKMEGIDCDELKDCKFEEPKKEKRLFNEVITTIESLREADAEINCVEIAYGFGQSRFGPIEGHVFADETYSPNGEFTIMIKGFDFGNTKKS